MNQAATHLSTTALPATLAAGEPSTFVFEGHQLNLIDRDGKPWFFAKDLARVLGYRAAPDMTRYLKEHEKGTLLARTLGGMQEVSVVSEPGLYRAILNRHTSARALPGMGERIERFKDWVVGEVLPSIRATGSYVVPTAPVPVAPIDPLELLKDPHTVLTLIAHHAEKRLVAEARADKAEAQVEAARPAVEFVSALADSDGLWGLRAAGKALHQGPDLFIRWLRGRGDLYDLNGGPVAKQDLINRGLFQVAWEVHGGKPRPTTKITGRGMVHYAKALGVRPPGAPAQALLPGL